MGNNLELLKHSVDARGNIIGRVVALETCINFFLAKYFTGSTQKTIDILNLVFATTRITYASKVEIFCYIAKTEHPDMASYGKSVQGDLIEIAEFRNRFAHHDIQYDEDAQKEFDDTGTLCLLKYKNEKLPFKITPKELDEWCSKIQFYASAISKLI